jgi:hypothetical protein
MTEERKVWYETDQQMAISPREMTRRMFAATRDIILAESVLDLMVPQPP